MSNDVDDFLMRLCEVFSENTFGLISLLPVEADHDLHLVQMAFLCRYTHQRLEEFVERLRGLARALGYEEFYYHQADASSVLRKRRRG
jgi:hypothetical protein